MYDVKILNKYIYLLLIFGLVAPLISYSKNQNLKPDFSPYMETIFNAYTTKNLKLLLPISTGIFKDSIYNILEYQNKNRGQLPTNINDISEYLKKYEILGQITEKEYGLITVKWLLAYSKKVNPYIKTLEIEYYLIKESSGWKITQQKIKGQQYFK